MLFSGTDAEVTHHALFLICLGLFGFFHLLIYAFDYGAAITPFTLMIAASGLMLALRPEARLAFLILLASLLIDGVLQAPKFSNHTIIKNFLVVGIAAAGVAALVRRRDWSSFMDDAAVIGRWLLLGMYFFGVFHKINSDFLDPNISCATTLWQAMPLPALLRDAVWLHWLGIGGTLVIETLITVCLLVSRWRTAGIMLGIAFHALLALSGYAYYTTFSTLSIALHCLFLPPRAHLTLLHHPLSAQWIARGRSMAGSVLAIALALAWLVLTYNGSYAQVGLLWLVVPALLIAAVLMMAHQQTQTGHDRRAAAQAVSLRPKWWAAILIAAFFFNGATPYLGLKTAQSINMFANLRLEGGVSNHLILRQPPRPFGYLQDIVEVRSSSLPDLNHYAARGLQVTYYDLLNRMERAPIDATVTYVRNGELHEHARSELQDEFSRHLHPRWFRAWFHFTPVNLARPKPCALDN